MRFLWTSNSAKTLGIVLSNDEQKLIENNIIQKLNDFENCLKRRNHRKLSLMGKISVVKTFAIPKIIYQLIVLDNPPVDILEKIKFEISKQNKGLWKEIYLKKLNAFGGTLILESELHIQDCSQITKKNMFLWDI